jgi:hypothetical protein
MLVLAACSSGDAAIGEATSASPGYVLDAGELRDVLVVDRTTDITFVPEPKPDAPSSDAALLDAWQATCPGYSVVDTVTIPLPAAGTPSKLADVCAASTSPVQSGPAARITLTADPADAGLRAQGHVEVAAELTGAVMGLPVITTSFATISGIRRDNDGFAFDVAWGSDYTEPGGNQFPFSVTLEIACGDAAGSVRLLQTSTMVQSCLAPNGLVWLSSGDACTYCFMNVCEMAPSPILPLPADDELPLGLALDLRMKCVGRVGRALVLFAEHDGGDCGASYEWHVSGGRLTPLDRDVAIWTLPSDAGPHVAQVALSAPRGAAVASLMLAA